MTKNEAIARMRYRIDTATDIVGKGSGGKAYEDMEIVIKALEEIQQYRVIGTVEEIKEILQIVSEGQDDVDESGISMGLLHTLLEYAEYKKIGSVEEIKKVVRFLSLDNDNRIIEDLELLNKYKFIGTVEECRKARERQMRKKVNNRKLLRDFNKTPYSVRGDCPNCGSVGLLSMNTDYCNACGQKLDWSE